MPNNAFVFPSISNELFSFSVAGMEFALRWYALAFMAGLLIGLWIAMRAVRNHALWPDGRVPMSGTQISTFTTWIMMGVVVGGRLGSVLLYQPEYYLQHPFEIFLVWKGGMSFHGGLMGVAIATIYYCRSTRSPLVSTADMLALATPPAILLGRLANFINAELWGRPTGAPWGVIFPGHFAQSCGQAIGELCARHPSQLYEAALEGVILGAILIYLALRRAALTRPGRVAGIFFAGYGIARFIVEFVRQPDANFVSEANPVGLAWHLNGYGLTMGQILSIPMIIFGFWLIARSRHAAQTGSANSPPKHSRQIELQSQ